MDKNVKCGYYDGPVILTNKTIQELDKEIQEEKKKSKEMTDWEKDY